MYKDFLMQFAQNQNPLNGMGRTPPNPASLLAAATGNQNLLQNNPVLLHQVKINFYLDRKMIFFVFLNSSFNGAGNHLGTLFIKNEENHELIAKKTTRS